MVLAAPSFHSFTAMFHAHSSEFLTVQPTWTLPAPAKLNLFLHVTGRRSDGYHTLESLIVPIDRADFITLSPREDTEVIRIGGAAGVAADDDLAVIAARRLKRECGVDRGVSIGIDKRLPIGAGLGGGSSDAATVLLGLNRLWGINLSRERLMRLALDLGATCLSSSSVGPRWRAASAKSSRHAAYRRRGSW